jgi:UDP-glucuronate decarboxylase
MFNQKETPGPINLGSLYEHSMVDLAKTVIALTGSKSKVINKPLPIDDPKQRQPDLTLARKYLNWEPSIEPEVGLEKTIKYFASVI